MLDLLPDLCDLFPRDVNVLETQFVSFGQKRIFSGQAVTIKCFEDNSLVKSELAKPGKGKVLVVDGGGSYRRALIGDMIAESAVNNAWEGIIINGVARDVGTINTLNIGVKALGSCPIKTDKRGIGDLNIPLRFSGVNIKPNDWIYADENGVLVSEIELKL